MNKVGMLLLWCFVQTVFLELYIKLVLGAREKPLRALSEAFQPLLQRLSHTEFGTTVLPSAGKMLKRNPEIVMEAVGLLLTYTSLDLSKYTADLLPTILLQARHNDEARRKEALVLVTQLVLHSSDLDAVAAMFQAVKSVMLGMLFILTFWKVLSGFLCNLGVYCDMQIIVTVWKFSLLFFSLLLWVFWFCLLGSSSPLLSFVEWPAASWLSWVFLLLLLLGQKNPVHWLMCGVGLHPLLAVDEVSTRWLSPS